MCKQPAITSGFNFRKTVSVVNFAVAGYLVTISLFEFPSRQTSHVRTFAFVAKCFDRFGSEGELTRSSL